MSKNNHLFLYLDEELKDKILSDIKSLTIFVHLLTHVLSVIYHILTIKGRKNYLII